METFSPLAAILNVFWHVLLHDQMESRVCFPNACTKENSKKPCRNNNSEGWTTVCVCVSLKRGTEEQKNSVRKSITPLAFFCVQMSVVNAKKCSACAQGLFLCMCKWLQISVSVWSLPIGESSCSPVTYFWFYVMGTHGRMLETLCEEIYKQHQFTWTPQTRV